MQISPRDIALAKTLAKPPHPGIENLRQYQIGKRLSESESARRRALVETAVERLGSAAELCRALSVKPVHVRRWRQKTRPVPDRYLDALTAITEQETPQ